MSTGDWNPELYRKFEDERTRPARELLARVTLTAPTRIYDLGCGPGNSTELLVERFPGAAVIGTDNSEAMLASARARLPEQRFELSLSSTRCGMRCAPASWLNTKRASRGPTRRAAMADSCSRSRACSSWRATPPQP